MLEKLKPEALEALRADCLPAFDDACAATACGGPPAWTITWQRQQAWRTPAGAEQPELAALRHALRGWAGRFNLSGPGWEWVLAVALRTLVQWHRAGPRREQEQRRPERERRPRHQRDAEGVERLDGILNRFAAPLFADVAQEVPLEALPEEERERERRTIGYSSRVLEPLDLSLEASDEPHPFHPAWQSKQEYRTHLRHLLKGPQLRRGPGVLERIRDMREAIAHGDNPAAVIRQALDDVAGRVPPEQWPEVVRASFARRRKRGRRRGAASRLPPGFRIRRGRFEGPRGTRIEEYLERTCRRAANAGWLERERSKRGDPDLHLEWLLRFQVNGESFKAIARKPHAGADDAAKAIEHQSVDEAVKLMAARLGVELRPPEKGGRPRGSRRLRVGTEGHAAQRPADAGRPCPQCGEIPVRGSQYLCEHCMAKERQEWRRRKREREESERCAPDASARRWRRGG